MELLGLQAAPVATLAGKELVFLVLFALMGPLYWANYKRTEKLLAALAKVAGLLAFVYLVISGFDWLAHRVPADQRIVFFEDKPVDAGSRVPELAGAFTWFVWILLVLVAWYARRKFTTVCSLVLSAWDRGHWYMMPVIFVLLTVGLLLVAAAASPVLSPFIYTLF